MAYIYQNSAWAAYDTEKYVVNTNTFTTYPFTIKSPTTPIKAKIYGNMLQSGTPTPTTPIQPQECGDLETEGEHTGQYKIPILSGSTTTNIYLGEVQSTRLIKKLVFDGTENWNNNFGQSLFGVSGLLNNAPFKVEISAYSTHFIYNPVQSGLDKAMGNGEFALQKGNNPVVYSVFLKNTAFTSTDDFKAWLVTNYAAGTPVCVWYVLDTPKTAVINESIRKIGDYADTVTTSIPVTINSDSVDVNTTLKPSAVAAPSLSWSAGDDYKRSGGAWV